MAFCSECGSEIESDTAACPQCGHTAPESEPAEHTKKAAARQRTPGRAGLLLMALLLLIAFFLPTYDGAGFVMPDSFELLRATDVSFGTKALIFAPLVAAFLVILFTLAFKDRIRAVGITCLGLAAIGSFFMSQEVRLTMGPSGTVFAIIAGTGMALILAGSRTRRFRPSSMLGALTGVFGGALYIVALILPILPQELGRVLLIEPILLLINAGGDISTIVIASLDLLGMLLLLGASIICFVNAAPRSVLGLRMQTATRLWTWSIIVLLCRALVPIVTDASSALGSDKTIVAVIVEIILPQTLKLTKIALGVLVLFLLVPVGLSHLLVHCSAPDPGPLPGYGDEATLVEARSGPVGPETRLKTLKRMLDEGLISQEDFDRKKEELLTEM